MSAAFSPAYPLLSGLTARVRPLIVALAGDLMEARLPFVFVETGPRSLAQHQHNLDAGTSWTQVTKHLDAYDRGWPFGGSDAADLAPYETYQLHGPDKLQWNADDPIWMAMGKLAEARGLRWLGRTTKDLGHVEYPGPALNPDGHPNIQLAQLRLPPHVPRVFTV